MNKIIIPSIMTMVIFLTLLALKMTGVVEWSWLIITVPIWVNVYVAVFSFLCGIVDGLIEGIDKDTEFLIKRDIEKEIERIKKSYAVTGHMFFITANLRDILKLDLSRKENIKLAFQLCLKSSELDEKEETKSASFAQRLLLL